jgi:hypothetical protein
MFGMIVGLFLALFFLGLPLAILVLFALDILDRRNERAIESDRKSSGQDLEKVISYAKWGSVRATPKP